MPLTEDDLFEILQRSEGSIIRQYERAFRAYGIEVFFEEAPSAASPHLAALEKTGARGLLTVCERLLRDFKYELPGSGVNCFTVSPALIDHPPNTSRRSSSRASARKPGSSAPSRANSPGAWPTATA